MKLAYVTTYDARDVTQWSGLGFNIAEALRGAGCKLDPVGPLRLPLELALKVKKLAYLRLLKRRHLIDRDPFAARGLARQAGSKLGRSDAGIVFSPGTVPIAYLDCRQPIAFWTDATFAGMLGFYREFSDLSAETIRNGHALEGAALRNCRLAIYSSHWAARSAVLDYGVDEAKVVVVPFGANVTTSLTYDEARTLAAMRSSAHCELLFLGVDWERKGGATAYAVAERLNALGLPTTLTVIGCSPTLPEASSSFVRVLGRISKADPDGAHRLAAEIARAHFLILPTVADCTPVVFSEANALAVPCLTSDVGGIASIVTEGVNGHLFPVRDSVDAYCIRIEALMRRPEAYRELALGAFREYETRLNWRVAGATVRSLLRQHCL